MKDVKNKPSSPDSSKQDVSSEEGGKDVKSSAKVGEKLDAEEKKAVEEGEKDILQSLSIAEINSFTGREFKDKEDFLKHYDNLKSLVGKPKEERTEESSLDNKFVTKEEMALLDIYPEAKPYLEKLGKLKGADENLTQTYENNFKDLVEKSHAYDKSKEEETTPGVDTKPGLAPEGKIEEIANLAEQIKSGPNKEGGWGEKGDAEAKLVEEALGDQL